MAKNQERDTREKDKQRKQRPVAVFCYYDGAMYSPGAYVKVDGLEKKMLYCNFEGAWEVKDPPDD